MLNRYIKFKDVTISNLSGGFVLQDVVGEDGGQVTKRTINYIDTDGASYADFSFNPRQIEIDGFINADCFEQMDKMKRQLINACNPKEVFKIEYCNRNKIYTANAICEQLPVFERRFNYSWNMLFKIYITLPDFYWNGADKIKKHLFSLKDEVLTSFTLPCVFTSLNNNNFITNSGDVSVFPNYIIKNENPQAAEVVEITNKETGQKITFNYTFAAGETVIINSEKQTATSDINGNVSSGFSIDTEFFAVDKGVTEIEADGNGNIIDIEFYENFIGV